MTEKTYKDAKTFSRAFKQAANDHVEAAGKAAHKYVVGAVYEKIVETNPVLTSLSRGNWFLTLGSPSPMKTDKLAGVSQTGAPMTTEERGRLRQLEALIDATPLGQTAWITNNIHYIVYLNAGTSSKAPAGIVDVAVVGALSQGGDGALPQLKLL